MPCVAITTEQVTHMTHSTHEIHDTEDRLSSLSLFAFYNLFLLLLFYNELNSTSLLPFYKSNSKCFYCCLLNWKSIQVFLFDISSGYLVSLAILAYFTYLKIELDLE